ncbi:MAG: hypothetical protein H7844_15770 [Nitrospirae bacterium YQR-1]
MKINIVSDISMFRIYTKCITSGLGISDINTIRMDKVSLVSRNIIFADFWLIEVFLDSYNPFGFKLARDMAGIIKCLLVFHYVPDGFPKEGQFWCNIQDVDFIKKIKDVYSNSFVPSVEHYNELINIWPKLNKSKDVHRER